MTTALDKTSGNAGGEKSRVWNPASREALVKNTSFTQLLGLKPWSAWHRASASSFNNSCRGPPMPWAWDVQWGLDTNPCSHRAYIPVDTQLIDHFSLRKLLFTLQCPVKYYLFCDIFLTSFSEVSIWHLLPCIMITCCGRGWELSSNI